MIISRSVLLKTRNVSDTRYTENQNAFYVQNIFRESYRLYETKWKNIVETIRSQMAIRRMPIACWIPKATNTHLECAVHLVFQCKNGCRNAPQCYVTCILLVLFKYREAYVPTIRKNASGIRWLNLLHLLFVLQFSHSKIRHSAHSARLLYDSQNKQRILRYTRLNYWFFYKRDGKRLLCGTNWLFK